MKFNVIDDKNLLLIETTDSINFNDVTNIISTVYNDYLSNKDLNVLFDFRKSQNLDISYDEMRLIAEYSKSIKDILNRTRTAFIINNDKQKATTISWISMISSYVNTSNIKYSKHADDILDWLHSDRKDDKSNINNNLSDRFA